MNLFLLAQSWRNPVCAVMTGALKKKPWRIWVRRGFFPYGAPMAQRRSKEHQ